MKIAGNIEVLSVTPINDGRLMLLLLRDRNSGSEYFYTMAGTSAPVIHGQVLFEGIFPEN
jgi:hypothetical protein